MKSLFEVPGVMRHHASRNPLLSCHMRTNSIDTRHASWGHPRGNSVCQWSCVMLVVLPSLNLCFLSLVLCREYSWIGRPKRADKKIICQRTRRVTTLLSPPLESSRRGEFRSALSIFVKSIFDLLFFETSENRVPTKIDKADLDSPRRELSNGGLESVVTLLVRW